MAIRGDHFLASSITAFALMWNNLGRALAVSVIGTYLMGIGKILVALFTAGSVGLVMMKVYDYETNSLVMPVIVMFLLAYCVAAMFMVVYECVIDTLFICFLLDEKKNIGDNPKQYATIELKDNTSKKKNPLNDVLKGEHDTHYDEQERHQKEMLAQRQRMKAGQDPRQQCPKCKYDCDVLAKCCSECGMQLPMANQSHKDMRYPSDKKDADGGCCWEICGGGECLRDRSRAELLRRWSVRQDGKGSGPAALAVEEPE